MSSKQIEKVERATPDLVRERVEELRRLFPEAFTEGRVDFDKLRQTLGSWVDARADRYTFSWAGKRDAVGLLQTPSRATLKPAPEESVEFDATGNVFVEGENLEVLKLLYKSYFGRVKMIYIDPPYNIGNDFVYADNYAAPLDAYLRMTGQRDESGALQTSNVETSGRFHSAWLSMMYPRLFLARQLLRDDGVIFVSIDDNEVHNLRMLMNEVFGEENFVATFTWRRRTPSAMADMKVSVDHEYLIAYQRGGFEGFSGNLKTYAAYSNPDNDPNGDWMLDNLTVGMTSEQRPNQFYDLVDPKTKKVYPANPNRVWALIPESMSKAIAEGRVVFPEDTNRRPLFKRYKKDLKSNVNPVSTWIRGTNEKVEDNGTLELESGLNAEGTRSIQELFDAVIFSYSKPVSLLASLVKHTTGNSDIVLDFFAGSGTTAQAVLELNHEDGGNRRFVCVQLPEPTPKGSTARKAKFKTIADIGKERIRRIISRMKREREEKLPDDAAEDLGFRVFKLDASNIKAWGAADADVTPDAYIEQMQLAVDPLVPGWKIEDVVWEVALKEGYALASRVEPVANAAGNNVFRVADADKEQSFLVCLDDAINAELPAALGLAADDLFICRDAALDDTLAANLALQCRLKTI